MVSRVQIHRDQRMITGFDRARPMPVAQLESVIRECSCYVEGRLARLDLLVRLRPSTSQANGEHDSDEEQKSVRSFNVPLVLNFAHQFGYRFIYLSHIVQSRSIS